MNEVNQEFNQSIQNSLDTELMFLDEEIEKACINTGFLISKNWVMMLSFPEIENTEILKCI